MAQPVSESRHDYAALPWPARLPNPGRQSASRTAADDWKMRAGPVMTVTSPKSTAAPARTGTKRITNLRVSLQRIDGRAMAQPKRNVFFTVHRVDATRVFASNARATVVRCEVRVARGRHKRRFKLFYVCYK